MSNDKSLFHYGKMYYRLIEPLMGESRDVFGLENLLKEAIGSQARLIDFEVSKQLHDYRVLIARLGSPSFRVVIKLAGPDAEYPCSFDQSTAIFQLVRKQGEIPLPEVLAADVSYQKWPWRYFITTHLPGQDWAAVQAHMDAGQLADAYRQIGEIVARIHNIKFPSFGEIAGDERVLAKRSYLEALRERAHVSIREMRLREDFLSLLEQHSFLFDQVQGPCMCHEDLHAYNILFERRHGRWSLSGILDFDKAWAGHGEINLARMEFWDGMTSREFWETYLPAQPVPALYQQRKAIYQLLWCFEYAQPTERHIADTLRLCRQLGIQFSGRFEES